ncbi:MAG: peptidoglycan-binding protein [bacterium]|nr:peptidoglycan-binding protein [bacterium]
MLSPISNRLVISGGAVGIFLTSLLIPFAANAQVRSIVFPVSGPSVFRDDFHEPRGADGTREHLGIDIIADKMTPVVAAADGVISYVVSPQASWGYSISLRDAEGYSYRYLHLNNDTPGTDDGKGGEANAYAPGIRRGVRVVKGQKIGWVGDSGNAENTVSHLHFEIRAPERGVINPYESLRGVSIGDMAVFTQNIAVSKVVIAIPKDYTLIKYANSPTIFLLSKNIKYRILNTGTLAVLGKSAADARLAPDSEQYPTGSSISIASTVTSDHQNTGENSVEPTEASLTLSEGSRGPAVVELQTVLKTLHYFTSTVTEYFGPITKAALIRFQIEMGITDLLGVVGPKTRVALGLTYVPPVSVSDPGTALVSFTSPSLSEGSSGEAVRQLQTVLKNLGYFTSTVTNYFGPITKAAVIKFQIAKGIDPIGVVGPITKAALGLTVTIAAALPSVPIPSEGVPIAQIGLPIVQSGLMFRLFDAGATVIGTVNPNGSPTTYWYEYGSSPTLGSKTGARSLGSGTTPTSTANYISGLQNNATYYVRLTAENQYGRVSNTTYSFETISN